MFEYNILVKIKSLHWNVNTKLYSGNPQQTSFFINNVAFLALATQV